MPPLLRSKYPVLSAIALVSCLLYASPSFSQTVITPATPASACIGGAAITLSNITVAETANNGFNNNQTNATYILTAPTGFIFSSPNAVSILPSSANITIASVVVSSSSSLTITLSTNNATAIDNFIIQNLQVQSVSAATAVPILRLAGASAGGSFNVGGGDAARGSGISYANLTGLAPPTTSDAGPAQSTCNIPNFTLAGNTPVTGTGTWTVFSGSANITTPASPTSGVTAVPAGTSATLRWTISNGTCTASVDDVVLTNYAPVTAPAAGGDINQCGNGTFTLAGNNPAIGTGVWTVVSGTAAIVTPSLNTSGVLGVPAGTSATLRWTITNGPCSSADDVILTNDLNPTPVISGLNSVCANAAGVIYTTPNVVGHTYLWTIGGGSVTAGAGTNSITVTWGAAGPGTLTVAETITATGCAATTSNYNVAINANPAPVIGGAITVCSGQTGVVYNTTAVVGHTYLWSVSSGTITAGAGTNSITVAWAGPGAGTVAVTETISATGCSVATAPYSVTINPIPTPIISGLNEVCENAVGVNYSTPGIVGHTYGWLIIGGTITSGTGTNAIIVDWAGAGTGTLRVVETITATGCTVTTPNFDITINSNPAPVISGVTTVCSNQAGVGYSTPFVAGHTYVWTISGGIITSGAGTASIQVTWDGSAAGSVSVAETVAAFGCVVTTAPYNVTINPLPTPAISGLNTVCENATGQIYTTPNVGGHTYLWTITGGAITAGAGTNSITVTWGAAGPGTLTVAETITASGCAVTTSNYNVAINAGPAPVITGAIVACANQAAVAYSTPSVVGHTYVWTISGGTITSGAGTNSIQVTWGGSGTGSVMVEETISSVGCAITTAPYNVTINPLPTPVISGLNAVCANATGLIYNTPNVVGHTYAWTIGGGSITAGAGTNAITVSWGATSPGSLTVAETITATGCAVTTSNYNVTINAKPAPVISGPVTACSNQAGVGYSTAAVGGNTYTWIISGGTVTGGAGTASVLVTWGAAGVGTLTVAETISSTGCTVTTAPYGVTINPLPAPVISGLNSVCENVTGVVYSTPFVGGNTYLWTIGGGAITAGAGTNSITVTWGAAGPGTLTVAQTITVSGCAVTTSNYNVTINANPAPFISGTTSVCSNQSGLIYNTPLVAGHSYVWTIAGGTITAGAGTNSITVDWGGAGAGQLAVAETITATGCAITTAPYAVTINPVPSFSIANASPAICSGSLADITLTSPTPGALMTLQNVNYGAVTGGLYAAGGTFSTGGHLTESAGGLVNPTTAPITVVYIFSAATVSCSNLVTQQTSITVNPTPAMTINNTTPAICSGSAVSIALGSVTSGATITLNSVNYGAASGTIVAPQTYATGSVITESIVNTTNAPVNVTYSFSVSANGCTTAGPFTAVVTVNAIPTVAAAPLNATLCGGQSTNILLSNPNAVTGGVTYNWTVSVLSGTSLGQSAGTGTSIVQALTTDNVGGIVRYTIRATATTGGCVGPPVNVDVTVNPVPNVAVDITSTATLCSGTTTNILLQNPNAVSGTTYQWATSIISGVVSGHGTGSGNIISQTLTTSSVGGVVQYSITPRANGCSGTVITWNVTVNPVPVSVNAVTSAVCSHVGFSFDPQLEITNGVVSTFAWTALYDAGLTGGIAGGTGSVTGTLTNLTGGVLNARFTITPTAPGPGSCVGAAFTIRVPINPEPVGTTLTLAPVCSDVPFSLNPQAQISNGVASTFTWTAVYGVGLTGGALSGTGALAGTVTNETGSTKNAVFTVTPTSTAGCAGTAFVVTLPISTEPKGINATAAIICSDSSPNYNLQTNVNGVNGVTSNFTWVAAANGNVGGESATPQSGPVINDLLVNVTGTNQTVVYTVTPTGLSGCQGNSFTVDVPVKSKPVGSNTVVAAVCSATSFSYNPQGNITNSMVSTFTWTASYASGLTGGGGIGSVTIAETLINLTAGTLNAVYSIMPTSGGCTGAVFTITVPIAPQPTGVAQTLTRCSNTSVATTLTTAAGSPAAATYTIAVNPNGLTQTAGTPSAGTGKLSTELQDDVWGNTGNAPVNVVYTITPISGSGCTGSSFIVRVSVNPEPVGIAQSTTRCSDVAVNYNLLNNVALLGNNVGSTFSWVAAANPSVGNESTVPKTGAIIDDALNNVTSTDQTVVYTVTPTAVTGCVGNTFLITVTVHPEPVGLTTSALTICSGSGVNYNLQTNVNGVNGIPSTFNWLATANGNVGGESTSTQTTTIITDILTNVTFSPQTVVYTVVPTGTNGCTGNPFTISDAVNPKAVISAGPDLAVCADSPSKQLQGLISYAPNGVVWSGGLGGFSSTAVATPNYFYANPAEVDTPVTLTLTANDPDGPGGPCTLQTDQMVLKVNALPTVGFFGLPLGAPPHAAENLPPMTLNGNQTGGLFTIGPGTGLGTTYISPVDGLDHVLFDPGAATLSVLNPITYTYTNANSCTNSVTHGVIIDQITTIDFSVNKAVLNSNNDWETCANQDSLRLIGFPDVSTGFGTETEFTSFSAYAGQVPPTIIKNGAQYYVQTAGLPSDTYVIKYVYKNSLGAISTKVRNLVIFAGPTAAISVVNSCIASPVAFTDASTLPPTAGPPATPPPTPVIASWKWDFDDLTAINTQQNPNHQYATAGIYKVKLIVTTSQGCVSSAEQQIRVGDVPIVDFSWKSICTNDSTKFRDRTVVGSVSNIVTYTWDFDDAAYPASITGPNGGLIPGGTDNGNTSGSYKKPNHAYLPGVYDVTLSVDTNDGCHGDSTKRVFILPTKQVQPIPTNAYFENFENSTHGWQAQSIDSLKPLAPVSWQLGTPSGLVINSASSASNSWWTGAHPPVSPDSTTYYPLEKTAVNGPCFDLTLLTRPMIALNYWVDTQKDFDGAVMQYSTDGGDTWKNVGAPLQGINWYSNDLIISNPGQQGVGLGPYGWTGQSGKWLNARSNLDAIPVAERKQVRIRIAIGSDAATLPKDGFNGFAFDDVFIGDKRRNVLIEHFTNATMTASTRADTWLDNLYNTGIALHGVSDFYDIRYHVSYPANDPLNQDNSSDPAARALYFGVTQPPFTILDGRLDAAFTGDYLEITAPEVDRRALTDPAFDLALTSSSIGNKITVTLDITALAAFNSPLIAQVALVEPSVGGSNKVLRKQLFGSDGETINLNWAINDVHPVVKTDVQINVPIGDPTKLMLVAFVQDKNTKEIYQSLAVPSPPVTGATITGIDEPPPPTLANEIGLYPNPASGEFYFSLPDHFPSGYTWKIADQRGIDVLSGDFAGAVAGRKTVEVSGLANGVYFVVIGAPDQASVFRKLVVMNRH